ncbi:MAG: glycosyltransferase family 4 protein [candidate division WOR-3 bacterium]|nr:glycosyltransferase family 4 protein [candidate division WOR-3 bacterium]MDH5683400.1 glycosyltransferase family 4 protein [candidate division WOR-3 bacterium]
MRIGIDVRVLRKERGGVGHYLANLLEKFAQLDKDDTFFLYSSQPIKFKPIASDNWYYRFGTLPFPGFLWFHTWGKDYIIRDEVDIFFEPFNILPQNLPRKIKKIVVVHDFLAIYPYMLSYYGRFLHKIFFKKSLKIAEHIITVSEVIKRNIVHHFQIDPKKITVIYEGVGLKFRPYEKTEVLKFRERYNLLKPYILTVATLEPCKNYPTLLRAFKRLKTDWDLVIIGKRGWKYKEIFSLIEELKLSEQVKILGYVSQDNLPLFYNGAEIYVHPSWYEGFGLPVLEAMACGTVTVASNSSSLTEVGDDAVLYFNPWSVDELVFKIETLLDSYELRENLKEKGIKQAKNFTWEKTAQKTLMVLKGK